MHAGMAGGRLTLRWEKDMRYPCARDLKFSSIWETYVSTGY